MTAPITSVLLFLASTLAAEDQVSQVFEWSDPGSYEGRLDDAFVYYYYDDDASAVVPAITLDALAGVPEIILT